MFPLSRPDFIRQIRLALQNLHDFAALQKLPLTTALSGPQRSLDQSVRFLRSEMLAAIEQLNPPGSMSPRAKERRPYALLYGRYVQGMTTAELVADLAISVRQLRREHARALNAVTELLWACLAGPLEESSPALPLPVSPASQAVAQVEAEHLISQAHLDDLALPDLVDGILATLAPAAAQHPIRLENHLPADLPLVRANRVVLRQGLMGVMTYALHRLQNGSIRVEGTPGNAVRLWVTARGSRRADEPGRTGLEVSQQLLTSLAGRIEIVESGEQWRAQVTLPVAEDLPLLVMDDNAGLVELFRRYLAGRNYHLLEAHSADEALAIAQKTSLRLILLDVMMPEQDGWEILQRLRAAPETRATPIIICSVLNEPEIASTLGASDYLPKPVTQDALLTKVEQWCRLPRSPGEPRTE